MMSSWARAAPDEAGEQIGGAHLAARHPDPDRLGREPGRLGGDAQVARVREREPAAVGGAVDRGDHRLREPAERRDRVAEVRLPAHPGRGSFEAGRRRRRSDALQVEAGAEPPAGAGEHDRRARLVTREAGERRVEAVEERDVDRVQALGPVQRHELDSGPGPLGDDGAHRPNLAGVGPEMGS